MAYTIFLKVFLVPFHFSLHINMNNMNILCFISRNELDSYMELLVRNFNIHTVDNIMCRNLINVNWNGRIYDCDFNQQLEMEIRKNDSQGNSCVARIRIAFKDRKTRNTSYSLVFGIYWLLLSTISWLIKKNPDVKF